MKPGTLLLAVAIGAGVWIFSRAGATAAPTAPAATPGQLPISPQLLPDPPRDTPWVMSGWAERYGWR